MRLINLKNLVLLTLPLLLLLGSCSKDTVDPEKQAQQDEATIVKFLADKNIAAQRHSSGVYYQIINPGAGNITYSSNTTVSAKYAGRLLSGVEFDKSAQPIAFKLGGVIAGWQIGVPLIQKGGKIRLFIPSGLGYGVNGSGPIPANAVLDFDIELADVTN
ncbi:MAG: FKBP-type peptidyl-prolyl cis-trans isomerase [Daejeonella sp.]